MFIALQRNRSAPPIATANSGKAFRVTGHEHKLAVGSVPSHSHGENRLVRLSPPALNTNLVILTASHLSGAKQKVLFNTNYKDRFCLKQI
jgi:hypothetical protein